MISSGEDVPRGHSLRGRLIIVPISKGDIDPEQLSHCQQDAAEGLYGQAMAAYIAYLAPRLTKAREKLARYVGECRAMPEFQVGHARTPEALANLYVGLSFFLSFAVKIGAIEEKAKEQIDEEAIEALSDIGKIHCQHVQDADPVERALELLRSALSSGLAHLTNMEGIAPQNPSAFGWKTVTVNFDEDGEPQPVYQQQGTKIGWVSGDDLYLDPDTILLVMHKMAQGSEGIAIGSKTLNKRLFEKGYLVSTEAGTRDTYTMRKTLEGARRNVLHLKAETLIEQV